MSWRRLPAVVSPISIAAVARALPESLYARRVVTDRALRRLGERFAHSTTILTDSGTSALVLALRMLVPPGGTVGFPGFACVDLAAAAEFAGVRVRLYDLDPVTLSPDLESVRAMLARGVDAIVVAHLFGYPADVPAVRAMAEQTGVPIIEDAAQGAGGSMNGRRLGTLGDLSVLSFGRGKGLCAGGGGALLAFGDQAQAAARSLAPTAPGLGWMGLAKTAAQFVLGRPSLYAIPSMIPGLHLGEMVYHPAHEPRPMPVSAVSLLTSAISLEPDDVEARRRSAAMLASLASQGAGIGAITPLAGAQPGYLRYPVRDLAGDRVPNPALGVLRSYPQTLSEQPQMMPLLVPGEPDIPGAVQLRRTLFTLPTHRWVNAADLNAIARWIERSLVPPAPG